MNDPFDPLDDSLRAREWRAQERAMREERSGAGRVDDDALTQRYRVVARVLGEPLPGTLPLDFAQDVARRVQAEQRIDRRALPQHAPPERITTAFERRLLTLLIALFGIAMGIVVARFSADGLSDVVAWASRCGPLLKNPWLLALCACMGLSSVLPRRRGLH